MVPIVKRMMRKKPVTSAVLAILTGSLHSTVSFADSWFSNGGDSSVGFIAAVDAGTTVCATGPGTDPTTIAQHQFAIMLGCNAGLASVPATGFDQSFDDIFIGKDSGLSASAYEDIFIGTGASEHSVDANHDIAIGDAALSFSQGVSTTVAIGLGAGSDSSQSSDSLFLGDAAGTSASAQGGVAIGLNAGSYGTLNGTVLVGSSAGSNSNLPSGIAIGQNSGSLASGEGDTYLGDSAGNHIVGDGNVIIGQQVRPAIHDPTMNLSDVAILGFHASAETEAAAVGATAVADVSAVAVGYGATAAPSSVAEGSDAIARGIGSVAVGSSGFISAEGAQSSAAAVADGDASIAMGPAATAAGKRSVAVGLMAQAAADSDVAIGDSAASGIVGQNVAIGAGATANAGTPDGGAVAIGRGNRAIGNGAIAAGDPTTSNGQGAIAEGFEAIATSDGTDNGGPANGAVALGNSANVAGQGSVSIGNQTKAATPGTIAIGDTAKGMGAQTVAIGQNAVATDDNDVAIGARSSAAAAHDGTIGTFGAPGAGSPGSGVVAVGNASGQRQLQFVAPGVISATSTDGVNGSQLFGIVQGVNSIGGSTAAALGGGASYDPGSGALMRPTYHVGGQTETNVGDALATLDENVTDLGDQLSTAQRDMADLGDRVATSEGGIDELDDQVTTVKGNVTNLGSRMNAVEGNVTSLDERATNVEGDVHSLESTVSKNTNQIAALGDRVGTASKNVDSLKGEIDSGTIGLVQQQGSVLAKGKITIGAQSGGAIIDVRGMEGTRQITSVTSGSLSASSTDAINGSQLFATYQKVDQNTTDITALGGRVTNVEGEMTRLGDTVATNSNEVGDLRSQVGSVQKDVAGLNAGRTGLVQQTGGAPGNGAITIGAGTGGDSINLSGANGVRRLRGVASGDLSSTSTDAVNGLQLNATNEKVNRNTGDIASLDDRVSGVLGAVTSDALTIRDETAQIAALDKGAVKYVVNEAGNPTNRVNLNGDGSPVTIANVAAGVDDEDAVNVGQLREAIDNADGSGLLAVKYAAGPDGKPTNIVALTGDSRGSPVKITNVAAGVEDSDAANYGQIKNQVSYDVDASGTRTNNVTLGGNNAMAVKIRNVADGMVNSDAANIGQLNAARQEARDYTDERFNALSGRIGNVQREMRGGIASVSAASQLHFDNRPGKISVAAGLGVFNGSTAFAAGLGWTSDDQIWRVGGSAGISLDTGNATLGVGASYTLN